MSGHNKADVRWVTLTNDDGSGLMVGGLPQFKFSALHYAEDDIEQAAHPHDPEKLDDIILTVNHKQMGVWNSWGGTALPQFMLYADQTYSYNYTLKPIEAGQSAMDLSKRQIDLELSPVEIKPGELTEMIVTGKMSDGKPLDLADATLEYFSSHPELVSFDTQYENKLLYLETDVGDVESIDVWAEVTVDGKTVKTKTAQIKIIH